MSTPKLTPTDPPNFQISIIFLSNLHYLSGNERDHHQDVSRAWEKT